MMGMPVVLRASRASLAGGACHRHQVSVAMAGSDDTCHLDVAVGRSKRRTDSKPLCTKICKAKALTLRDSLLRMGQVMAEVGSQGHRNKGVWLVADKVTTAAA